GFPEFEGQVEEGGLDVFAESGRRPLLVGTRTRHLAPVVDRLGEGGGGAALTPAYLVDEGVVGDAPQPSIQGAESVVGQAPPDTQQDLLDQVGGVVRVTTQPVREVVDLPPMGSCYLFPGQRILCHRLSSGGTTNPIWERFPGRREFPGRRRRIGPPTLTSSP